MMAITTSSSINVKPHAALKNRWYLSFHCRATTPLLDAVNQKAGGNMPRRHNIGQSNLLTGSQRNPAVVPAGG